MRAALAVIKLRSSIDENIATIKRDIINASENKADIVIFGEAVLTGLVNNDDPKHDIKLGVDLKSRYINELCSIAKAYKIHIAFGLFELADACLYDTAVLITSQGDIGMVYRRISKGWHAPDADPTIYKEGTEVILNESSIGGLCFLICGDLFDDILVDKVRCLKPDYLLFPFARSFSDYSANDERWIEEELPQYKDRVIKLGITLLMVNYIGDPTAGDYCFGGAAAIDGNGSVLGSLPLGVDDILYIDL